MNSSNSASVSNFEHLSFQINNPFVDPNGEIELAMDVCRSSTSSSDHCFSTASVSIISDCESQELSDLEENDSENVEQVVDNPRDLEEDAIDDLEDENLMDGFSNSSVSSYDEMDYASSSDDGEVVNVPIVEVVEENDHFQYSMDDPTYIVVSSDDGSEVASDLGEELEEATLEDEPVDDRSEVGSETSVHSFENDSAPPHYSTVEHSWVVYDSDSDEDMAEDNDVGELEEATLEDETVDDRSEVGSETSDHSLENDSAPPPYSTVDHSWVVYDSDSDEDMAEENDVGELEETTLDEEHNGADQSEISSLESGNDLPMDDSLSIPKSDSIAENNGNVQTSVSSSSELRRKEEFLQTAPFASTASDYEPSLTTSEDAEFRVFIQRTRELEARVDVQEVAAEVHEVAPELLDFQVVAVGQPIGFGIVETQLDVVIGNGGILPQLPSYIISHDWLHNIQNHF